MLRKLKSLFFRLRARKAAVVPDATVPEAIDTPDEGQFPEATEVDGAATAELARAEGDAAGHIEESVDDEMRLEDADADDFEDEEEEEEDIDVEEEWEKLEEALKTLHPKLKDTRDMVPNEQLEMEAWKRRNPLISLNSRMVMPALPPEFHGVQGTPKLIGVTGHRASGGNIGLNGIYELYSDSFHDRPVYQKTLEKRWEDDLEAHGPGMMRTARAPLMSSMERFEADKSQSGYFVRPPRTKRPGGLVTMWPTGDAWFLFYDRGCACWCIGPAVGHSEICARCPGLDDHVPTELRHWEVWDVGKKCWYEHPRLRTFRGGLCAAAAC